MNDPAAAAAYLGDASELATHLNLQYPGNTDFSTMLSLVCERLAEQQDHAKFPHSMLEQNMERLEMLHHKIPDAHTVVKTLADTYGKMAVSLARTDRAMQFSYLLKAFRLDQQEFRRSTRSMQNALRLSDRFEELAQYFWELDNRAAALKYFNRQYDLILPLLELPAAGEGLYSRLLSSREKMANIYLSLGCHDAARDEFLKMDEVYVWESNALGETAIILKERQELYRWLTGPELLPTDYRQALSLMINAREIAGRLLMTDPHNVRQGQKYLLCRDSVIRLNAGAGYADGPETVDRWGDMQPDLSATFSSRTAHLGWLKQVYSGLAKVYDKYPANEILSYEVDCLKKAEQITKELLKSGTDDIDQLSQELIENLQMTGNLYMRAGDYGAAEPYFQGWEKMVLNTRFQAVADQQSALLKARFYLAQFYLLQKDRRSLLYDQQFHEIIAYLMVNEVSLNEELQPIINYYSK